MLGAAGILAGGGGGGGGATTFGAGGAGATFTGAGGAGCAGLYAFYATGACGTGGCPSTPFMVPFL
jgi:hypothetical protein